MKLVSHVVQGADQTYQVGMHGLLDARYIVLHNTEAVDVVASVSTLVKLGLGYHLIIDRRGVVYQLSRLDQVVHHAGLSNWRGQTGLNGCSIGLSFANLGPSVDRADTCDNGGAIRSQIADHYNGSTAYRGVRWEVYPDVQIQSALDVCRDIIRCYSISEIVRHDDIAIGRKVDTGPVLDMAPFRALLPKLDKSVLKARRIKTSGDQPCLLMQSPCRDGGAMGALDASDDVFVLSEVYEKSGDGWQISDWCLVSRDGQTRDGFVERHFLEDVSGTA